VKERLFCFVFALLGWVFQAAGADAANRAHPFILWTPDEAASIRHRIETQPWAKEQWQRLQEEKGLGQPFRNLFRYQIMGDEAAGELEKKYLLKFIGTDPDKPPSKLDQDNRHYDNYEDALRYDVLYDRLTPDQRRQIEDTFRVYIDFQLHHDTSTYGQVNWLPNMQWPRPMAAHLMALALGDEAIIRDVFNSPGGWKWYFDDYVSDGPRSLYNEEFGKQYSMIGEMLLWCRGLDHLSLPQYGYAYTGAHGGSMRGYLEGLIQLGFPRVDIPGGMPHYPRVTMGDARGAQIVGGPPNLFQHSLVNGYLPDGQGGNDLWSAANMNGRDHTTAKVDKMREPQWLEIAYAKWPEAHFDYFLAQMRGPKQEQYIPTLFWGLRPIDPAKVTAPAAPSYVAQERAFAMLRAEESPAYWESPAPAVAMQFASYYVHYTHDCFSLLGFYAYNRPIYLNRGIASGYAGDDPWTDSVRGHAGVVVDNQQARPVGRGTAIGRVALAADYLDDPPARFADDPQVKFVLCRARGLYAGVDQTRALLLTRDYLLDVFRLTSDKPRVYQWQVHALGQAKADSNQTWTSTTDLDNGALYRGLEGTPEMLAKLQAEPTRWDLTQVKKWAPGERPWSFVAVQDCATGDAAHSIMGKAWYDRQVGVRVSLLGEAGTIAYFGNTPEYHPAPRQERGKSERVDASVGNEVGGVSFIVQRAKPSTTFTALHEPFERGVWRVQNFRRIQETEDGVAVVITGTGIDDRAMIALGADRNKPATLSGNGEKFTFADRAWIHVGPDEILVNGDLRSATFHVAGTPKFIINGKLTPATVHDGTLQFGDE
jgi:hypothetical protein